MMLYCEDRYQVVYKIGSISMLCLFIGMSRDFLKTLVISRGESVLLNVKGASCKISLVFRDSLTLLAE
jgi:hypothetical protein